MTTASKKRTTTKKKRSATKRKAAKPSVGKTKAPAKSNEEFTGPERLFDFADAVEQPAEGGENEAVREARLETWITFRLAKETFALPVAAVQEILRVSDITRVPHAPHTVRGIINMRGRVVPVVDFRVRLGLNASELTSKSRILVTSSRNRLLGLLVDAVEQVARLDRNAVEAAPGDVMTEQSEYITGVYHLNENLLILLDVDKVLLVPDSLQEEVA